MIELLKKLRQHLLTGVSYAIPFIACGGILIACAIAGKPGLVPGFVGGYLSGEIKAGFLGALIAGLLAGYVVQLLKKIPVSKHLRPVMPILVIPIVSSLVVGVVMLKVL